MNVEEQIKQSDWWRDAEKTPDRHYEESEGVMLADHLVSVQGNLHQLLNPDGIDGYFDELRQALTGMGLDLAVVEKLLSPVALLHDIGKPREDKGAKIEHPLTRKETRKRHPVVGLIAAMEILPDEHPEKDKVLALIDAHDTPFSWYMQAQKTGQIPNPKSWAKLDRKIDPREDGTGMVLLALFKLADIDGHVNVEDVCWFLEQANSNYLNQKGKWIPVPTLEDIKQLEQG